MPLTKEKIVDFIREKAAHPMKMKELALSLGITSKDYAPFRNVVKELISSGELVKLKRGRIGLVSEMDVLVGKVTVTRGGTGFVENTTGDQDIMILPAALGTALDGDKVMVRMGGFSGPRKTGTIIKIVERAKRNIVGVFKIARSFASVSADNPRIHRDIYIPASATGGAKDGEKVVAVLTAWDDPNLNPEGKVVEILGLPSQPGVDMLTIIKSYSLPERFPAEVLDEAEQVAVMPEPHEIEDRLDLTDECVYTIDPADAKDHDDAVSVKKTSSGYELGIHIADVSFFVKEGSELDREALVRGNSVYLPGMVLPMLPEILSNDICSLKVNRRRLAHTVFIDFDKHGKMVKWRLADTVVKSKAKLAYEEVQDFFDGKDVPARVQRVGDNLILARKLARLLVARRSAEGSLDFDLPEAKIILNKQGEVLELGHRIRLESHRLVEEFMLAANRAVALEVFRQGQPFIYRVHDRPDTEKLEAFSQLMARLGYKFPVSPQMKPIQFARFLDKIKDDTESEFINELMLRSMKKAVYQRQNIGHFGLAFSHYTHFTSPIRRYPDMLVHRLLRLLVNGHYPVNLAKNIRGIIDHVSTHCSETEKIAETAERQAVKVKQVAFMARHVGDEFSGVISGVTGFGFFVRLDNLGAEGLIRISGIDDDYYNFDEKHYRLVGRRSGRIFRLGDKVRVIILAVDKVNNEINLLPVLKPAKKTKKAKDKKNTHRQRKRRR